MLDLNSVAWSSATGQHQVNGGSMELRSRLKPVSTRVFLPFCPISTDKSVVGVAEIGTRSVSGGKWRATFGRLRFGFPLACWTQS